MTPTEGQAEGQARSRGRGVVVLALLVLAVFGFHAGTLRDGHTWWGLDDVTAYLLHGRNVLEGRPYADIGTVVDPGLPPAFERTAFPPVFSVVVALVERAATGGQGGLLATLRPLKTVLAACFALSLLGLAVAFREAALRGAVWLAMGATACSPFLYAFRDVAFSESLFLLLLFSGFAVSWRLEQPGSGRGRWALAVLLGVLVGLCYGTRTAALALFPALLVHDLLAFRRLRPTTLVTLGAAAGWVALQKSLVPAVEGGYLDKFLAQFHWGIPLENLAQFQWNLERLWWNGFSTALQKLVFMATGLLAAIGFVARLGAIRLFDVFTVGYMAMLLLLPTESAWLRYLIPVLPILMLDLFAGAAFLARRGSTATRGTALAGAALLVVVTYTGAYAAMDTGPLQDGLSDPATEAMLAFVDEQAGPDELVVFGKPRALAILTGRRAMVYPRRWLYPDLTHAQIWRHLVDMGTGLFVLKHTPATVVGPYNVLNHTDGPFLEEIVQAYPDHFRELWRNGEFVAYRREGRPQAMGDGS